MDDSRAMAEPESVAHDANVRLKPLPGAKSKVWKFFGFATNENGTIAQGTVHALFISDRIVLVGGKPEEHPYLAFSTWQGF